MDGNAGKVGAGGKAQQQQQNFDSRTLALLNRLASRRQSSGPASGARPDSAKADATPPGGKVAAGAAGRAGTALPVRDARVPIDLSGKTSGNQVRLQSRPCSCCVVDVGLAYRCSGQRRQRASSTCSCRCKPAYCRAMHASTREAVPSA